MFIIKVYDLTNAVLRAATLADLQAAFTPGAKVRTVGDATANANKSSKLVVDFMETGKDFQLIIEDEPQPYNNCR